MSETNVLPGAQDIAIHGTINTATTIYIIHNVNNFGHRATSDGVIPEIPTQRSLERLTQNIQQADGQDLLRMNLGNDATSNEVNDLDVRTQPLLETPTQNVQRVDVVATSQIFIQNNFGNREVVIPESDPEVGTRPLLETPTQKPFSSLWPERVHQTRGKRDMWKTKVAKPGDALYDAHEGDIIVPHVSFALHVFSHDDHYHSVIGPAGVGKSSFVNTYLNQENAARVGHELAPCTENLQVFCLPLLDEPWKGRRLVLVDTPGFEDTSELNSEILRRIEVWLASSYGPKKTCGGLIYLHDITDSRMRGTTPQNFELFQRLCGKKNLGAVVLGTTKSGSLTPEVFAGREKLFSDMYWMDFKKGGAKVFNLLPTNKSADELVSIVLNRVREEERMLFIKNELVDLSKVLAVTEVGQGLKVTLEEIIQHLHKALAGEELTDEQIAAHKNNIAVVGSQLKESQLKESKLKEWMGKLSQCLKKFIGLA